MGDDTCSIEGCERTRWARGWCNNHYQLWRRNGSPARAKGRPKPCSVEACEGTAKTRGWCSAHYQRWWVDGEPGTTPAKISRRKIVDGCKTCGTCGQTKRLSDFNKHPHGSGGVGANCRLCLAAATRAWFAANPDYSAKWRRANADVVLDKVHRRRAMRAGVGSEKIDPAAVFARDGFICQLCGDSMDMAADRYAPLSASLDHIVPLTRGGSHTYANVQAAHLYCNVSKGNRDAPLSRPSQVVDPDPG